MSFDYNNTIRLLTHLGEDTAPYDIAHGYYIVEKGKSLDFIRCPFHTMEYVIEEKDFAHAQIRLTGFARGLLGIAESNTPTTWTNTCGCWDFVTLKNHEAHTLQYLFEMITEYNKYFNTQDPRDPMRSTDPNNTLQSIVNELYDDHPQVKAAWNRFPKRAIWNSLDNISAEKIGEFV